MLEDDQAAVKLEFTAYQYLRDTLGLRVEPVENIDNTNVPYFLQETYKFRRTSIDGKEIYLAINPIGTVPLAALRQQISKARAILNAPIVYVTASLASYERKRLIEQKVPFLVPGNQMYLPDLGIDLREYFKSRPVTGEGTMSPATQAILISILWRRPWRKTCEPTVIAMQSGYSAMTLSRAMRELESFEIIIATAEGRQRKLSLPDDPLETWQKAQPFLRSPVRRTFWSTEEVRVPPYARKAGLSALADYSALAEPNIPCYAIDGAQRRGLSFTGDATEIPEPNGASTEWQIWYYSPSILPDSRAVDPLSLFLSLKNQSDERVQIALNELKEHFPW